jgi:hypothetical protein
LGPHHTTVLGPFTGRGGRCTHIKCRCFPTHQHSAPPPPMPNRLRHQHPNLILRIMRAMRVCQIAGNVARFRYVRLFCALRTLGADSKRHDVSTVMEVLLHDHHSTVQPSERLLSLIDDVECDVQRNIMNIRYAYAPMNCSAAPI